MKAYLDASVLVSLFVLDALTAKARRKMAQLAQPVAVSDFAAAEFSSAIGRRVRMRDLTKPDAQACFAAFDTWSINHAVRIETQPADIAVGDAFLRRLDLPLRAPDALNIAIARREGLPLLTFDVAMAACARKLGVVIVRT